MNSFRPFSIVFHFNYKIYVYTSADYDIHEYRMGRKVQRAVAVSETDPRNL